jgi:hypothetical protein
MPDGVCTMSLIGAGRAGQRLVLDRRRQDKVLARLKRHGARSTSSNAFHDHLKVGCCRYIIRSICNCKLLRWQMLAWPAHISRSVFALGPEKTGATSHTTGCQRREPLKGSSLAASQPALIVRARLGLAAPVRQVRGGRFRRCPGGRTRWPCSRRRWSHRRCGHSRRARGPRPRLRVRRVVH